MTHAEHVASNLDISWSGLLSFVADVNLLLQSNEQYKRVTYAYSVVDNADEYLLCYRYSSTACNYALTLIRKKFFVTFFCED